MAVLVDAGDDRDRQNPDSQSSPRHMPEARDNLLQVVQQGTFGKVDAENLGKLIDDDHGADAGLEPDQHRLGNEAGHEAEPADGSEHQDRAHHEREQRAGREQRGWVAIGRPDGKLGAGQDGERGGRGGAHRAR
jgi:hypothetical protein